MPKPKEMEVSIQCSYADERWHITVQAWLGTQGACDSMIRMLEILKPLLAKNSATGAVVD